MYFTKLSFYLFCLGILSARLVLAVDIGVDTTINANSTERHTITDGNVTLTNNADIILASDGTNGTIISTQTGTTIINNAGATIGLTGNNDGTVSFTSATNPTLINSGTVVLKMGVRSVSSKLQEQFLLIMQAGY